jgi:hypothetical protein
MVMSYALTALSASWSGAVRELAGWFRTRVLQARVALLCVVVLAAAGAGGATHAIFWTAFTSAALVLQFRLWDDLEDVPHDRHYAPSRTLVRVTNLRPIRLVLRVSVLLLAVWIWWAREGGHAAGYLLLVAATAALYQRTDPNGPRRPNRLRLVTLKYPAFVFLLVDEPTAPAAIGAAFILYVVLEMYEWWERRAEPAQ